MSLPRYLKNNQSGQVLVIFLLVLVIGLALVLSIASRTVTDIRQTTTSDESNRAYFAAESGVEDALKKIESNFDFDQDGDGNPDTQNLNFTAVNRTNASVDVTPLRADQGEILDFQDYQKDDVAQINLMADFDDLGSAGGAGSILPADIIVLHYGAYGTSPNVATTPAIEVSFINNFGVNWGIRKMTFDPNSGRTTNGFCQGLGTPVTATSTHKGYAFSATIKLATPGGAGSDPACATNADQGVPARPVIARVRFLYGPSPLGVQVTTNPLPQQGQLINSIGETPSGVSRKLQVKRFYPTLPAIFDYVLYNGSSDPLCKGSCP